MRVKKHERRLKEARDFLSLNDSERETLLRIERIGDGILQKNKLVECPEVTFSTDAPGGNFFTRLLEKYGDNYRFLRRRFLIRPLQLISKLLSLLLI